MNQEDDSWIDETSIVNNSHVTIDTISISGLYWHVTISDDHMKIGCENHLKNEWFEFDDDRINEMDNKALEFWEENEELLIVLCDNHSKRIK